MIWFFGRGNETTQVETRYDNATREYVLEVTRGGVAPAIERFQDLDAFKARVLAVEEELRASSWVQIGGPEIVPDGWRGPLPH